MERDKIIEQLKKNSRIIIFGALILFIAGGGYAYMQMTKPPVLELYEKKPEPVSKLKTAKAADQKAPSQPDDGDDLKSEQSPDEAAEQKIKEAVEKAKHPQAKPQTQLADAIDVEDAVTENPADAVEPPQPREPLKEQAPKVNEFGQQIRSLLFERNMPVRDALELLAGVYKKNIVPSAKVQGSLAFTNLYDVTFEEAMDAILGVDYRYERTGSLVRVYTDQEFTSVKRDSSLMIYKVFTLYYVNAAEANTLLSSVLSQDGSISITTAANTGVPSDETISFQSGEGGNTTAMNDTLIVHDYPENIARAEQIISEIDIRPKQVLIEATILSATLTEGMQFGIDWQTLNSPVIDSLGDLVAGTANYFSSSGTSARIGSESLEGGFNIGFIHNDVATFIRAVEDVTDVTILANPKILAVNKQLGQVYIGKKIAYQSQTTQTESSTTEQVQFLDTGTKLSFRPYIGNDGYIRMDIHPKDSSATLRTAGTSTLPDETSAELVTNIFVKDGQTIAIGGLFRDKTTTSKTQVPVLGDIPVIGGVFRGSADEVVREEVIVLLTPHIIDDPQQSSQWATLDDVSGKMSGANRQLQWINKVRRAKDHFDRAASLYVEGKRTSAIEELDAALDLYPAYLDAIRLREKIMRQIDLQKLSLNH